MPSKRTPITCVCGCSYQAFRTGFTFSDIVKMLWDQPDPTRDGWWRQKRRHAVLGYFREIKISMFYSVHGMCDEETDEPIDRSSATATRS